MTPPQESDSALARLARAEGELVTGRRFVQHGVTTNPTQVRTTMEVVAAFEEALAAVGRAMRTLEADE